MIDTSAENHPVSFRVSGDASSTDLPDDILEEARRRLWWVVVVFTAANFLAYPVPRLTGLLPSEGLDRFVPDIIGALTPAIGLGFAAVLRSRRLDSRLALDLGLLFMVFVAFSIAIVEWWVFFSPSNMAYFVSIPPIVAVNGVCVWMVFFPSIVPATRGKVMLAIFASGAINPLTLLASYVYFRPDIEPGEATPMFVTSVIIVGICSVFALTAHGLVHKLSRRVGEARRLGSYYLTERIGVGGMGEVWRGEHRLLARPAAVKLVRRSALSVGGSTGTDRVSRRFEREAQATAQLRCPHSISLYDFGVAEDGTFYYVMELLEGLTLEHLVKRFGPQPASRVVHLLRQTCESLLEAHQQGLIHRDIKPANIFCCQYGVALDFVKVLDFGLVKTASDMGPKATQLTAEGEVAGTPAYMAPEMVLGGTEVDARADIYALGCVAYWLLTGGLVFDAPSPVQIAVMHVQEEPVPPSARTESTVPDALEALIMDCLQKRPDERPQSAAEVIRRLEQCQVGEPWTQTRAESWWVEHGLDSQGENYDYEAADR